MLNDLVYQHTLLMIQQWLNLLISHNMSIVIMLCFAILMIIEMIWVSCKHTGIMLIQSYLTNIFTLVFNSSIFSLISISSILALAESYQNSGLLSSYNQPLQILFSFFLFDLMLYLWHWANHHFECLWLFHKVHHSDKSMNTSTAFRIHFIELLLGALIKFLFIIATGVEVFVLIICESISTLFVIFHHFLLPVPGEKWLKWFFIVPMLHRVHHSTLRKDHDSNYGAVFSIWDHMFKTLVEPKTVEIGLINVKPLNFLELLTFGLSTKSPYAQRYSSNNQNAELIDSMIAEAAYYLAEKRNFVSGFEQLDWFLAEQQIRKVPSY